MKSIFALTSRIVLTLVLLAPLLPNAAGALAPGDSSDPYVVRDVAVDVTADTAADARSIAIRRGQMEAFSILIRRMTLKEDRARLPQFDSASVEAMVASIEFENERYSTTRYIADLTIGFDRDAVRRTLQLIRIPFAEAMSTSVLVLPIYVDAGAEILWDRPNEWWDAWAEQDWRSSLLPFSLPEGTLADLVALSADQAMRGNREGLDKLGIRYGTSELLVVPARWSTDLDSGMPSLIVEARQYGVAGERSTPFELKMRSGETDSQFLKRAAQEIGTSLADQWKKNAMVGQGIEQTMSASMSVFTLDDLITARTRLQRAPMIRSFQLERLSIGEAAYQLTYIGEIEQLSVSLAQYGIDLVETDEGWRLSLRR